MEKESKPQLRMVLPKEQLNNTFEVDIPKDYKIRPYKEGDKPAFNKLMRKV